MVFTHLLPPISFFVFSIYLIPCFSKTVSNERIVCVASKWSCPVQSLPIHYLETPLGGKPSSEAFWDPMVNNIQRKLKKWKFSIISKGGRLTLLQALLNNRPTYMLAVFKAPMTVCKKIEKIFRQFLWSGSLYPKSLPLVRWDIVSTPKESGGLGIFKVGDSNAALHLKWLWRFSQEENSLWRSFIMAKYQSPDEGVISFCSKFASSRAPWKAISKLRFCFFNHTKWDLRNGERILFWKDEWLDSGPLKSSHPRLFALSTRQDLCVSEAWNQDNGEWNFYPRRLLFNRESEVWRDLSLSFPVPSALNGNDSLRWSPSPDGIFSTTSARHNCGSYVQACQMEGLVLTNLWKAKIPKKCKFFIWSILHRSLNTADKLIIRIFRPPFCAL